MELAKMMSLLDHNESLNEIHELFGDNSSGVNAWPESNYTNSDNNASGRYFTVLIYCGLFVVAAIGNLTVFISLFRSRHRKSRISLMIRHLTIADLVVTFIMIPLEIGWRLTEQWLAGNLACKAFLFLRAFGLYLSSNVLVCVSLDRYFAVLHPLKVNDARRRGKCMLTWAWGISLLCSVPQSIVFHVASPKDDPNFVQCVTFGFFTSHLQQMAYNLFGVIAMYFVPLFVIVIAYTAIMCEISNKSKENSKDESYQPSSGRMRLRRSDISNIERARTRTLRMTITIVVVFVICWTPYVVITLWYTFEPDSARDVPNWLQDTLFMMAVSNSCMNPLVYGSYAINLKRECFKWICCFKTRSQTDIIHGPRVFASGQGVGIARRLYKCFINTLKVGSGVTRSTGTLHQINNRSPMMRPINQYIGIIPRKTMERPTSVGHISFLSEPLGRRGYRRSFHSDPCPCNEAIAGESSHGSEAHVPSTIL